MGPPDHPVQGNQKEAAEQEQQYYIQQLFRRYGQQDQLDFRGFQNLLLSLGLGEVRVVELDHENLGHDYVAHLDLLEVQEGLHSHSAGHSHPKHSHHSHHHHSHEEADGSSCSPSLTAVAGPTVESKPHGRKAKDRDHDHDHDHDHHAHDHKPEHSNTQTESVDHDHTHNSHEHSHGHSQEHNHDHDHEKDNTQTETPEQSHVHFHNHAKEQTNKHTQETNDLAGPSLDSTFPSSHDKTQPHHHGHHHHKHPHPHHYHHTPDTTNQMIPTQTTLASLQLSNPEALALQPSSQAPTSMPKRTRGPRKGKGQRGRSRTSNPTISSVVDDGRNVHEHDHDHHLHHEGQSSKEKRAVSEEVKNPNSSLAGLFEDMPHQHEEVAQFIIIVHF